MTRVNKFITPQILMVIIFTQLLVLLSNLPLIIRINRTPADRVPSLSNIDATHDYSVYLANITLGQNGYLFNRYIFDLGPPKYSIFHLFYIWSAKLGTIFNWESNITYHVVRLLTVEFYIFAIFFICRIFLNKSWYLVGVIMCLLGEISPLSFFSHKVSDFTSMPWWTDFVSLERLNAIPHHLVGQALLLISIGLVALFYRKEQLKYAILAGLTTFLGGLFFPPVILPIIFVVVVSLILPLVISSYKRKEHLKNVIKKWGLLVVVIGAGLALALFKWQEMQGPPWTLPRRIELIQWNTRNPDFNRNFLFLYGALPILVIVSVLQNLRKHDYKFNLLTIWAFFPYAFILLADLLQIPKIRLVQTATIIPMAILSTETIRWAFTRNKLIAYALLFIFSISTVPTSIYYLFSRIRGVSEESYAHEGIYIPKPIYDSFAFVKSEIQKDSGILTSEFAGNTLPAFTPVRIYFGHMTMTDDFHTKRRQTEMFYGRRWSDGQAKEFLNRNNISYVYYSGQENDVAAGALPYEFLKIIYDKNGVKIFKYK